MRRHLVATCLALLPAAALADDSIRQSVVKVTASQREPDLLRPWLKRPSREASGSGVVIEGRRVLTNAHVVLHASQVSIQPDQSGDKLTAIVEAVAPGIDLAVLRLEDDSFFDGHPPLEISRALPGLQEAVSVYGYPEGGRDLSITRGIVSRIEFDSYRYMEQGLRIQVDAAINPGNSGGPALADGRMIGIAFSRLDKADNIGYIIPAEEIALFLEDIGDGVYDGKPALIDEFQVLQNGSLRAKFRVAAETTGVLVSDTVGDPESHPLRVGDVVTKIGDVDIDNAGMVRIEGDRLLDFRYLVQRLASEGTVGLTIVREGREIEAEVPVDPGLRRWLIPYLMGGYPSYFVFGPLVFSEATDDFVRLIALNGPVSMGMAYQGNPLVTRFGDRPAFEGERLVVVAHPMFPHPIGRGYKNQFTLVVEEVDGVRVRNLKHLVETLREATGEYVEFTFHGKGTERVVFDRDEVMRATEDILSDNGIRRGYSEDIAPVWEEE